ncbi:MAG TPA: ABC transporter permease [Acidimicrobiia bacterium]|nr:ABC transporter permease [Acidimicrobiia bacterium]
MTELPPDNQPDDAMADVPEQPSSEGRKMMRRMTGVDESWRQALVVPALSILLALIVGAVIIMVTDVDAWRLMREDPVAALGEMLEGVWVAYRALFLGAFGSVRAISETLFTATPLILAGLAVAVGFQTGLFNIGARGQMFMGGLAAVWVGLHVELPAVLHVSLAILAAIVVGGIWGGITGLLKARTGAHEVITTIMLNFVAAFFVLWALKTPAFQEEGSNLPQSAPLPESVRLPAIFGEQYRVNIGLLIAIAAVFFVYWLMYRSTLGFEFRATGFSPTASVYAGMNVSFLLTAVMFVSGALAGVAGSTMTQGLPPYTVTSNFAGTIGFDAIALALLGRSHPFGVLWAGLLFGALIAGGRSMQAAAGVSVDLVIVMQALIIVFIAAPELVRTIFRLKKAKAEPAQLTKGWGG